MAHKYYILGRDGRTPVPCNQQEHEIWLALSGLNRNVAVTTIGRCEVSTSFTGLNKSRSQTPELFETNISAGNPNSDRKWTSPTWEAAERRHEEACRALQKERFAMRRSSDRFAERDQDRTNRRDRDDRGRG